MISCKAISLVLVIAYNRILGLVSGQRDLQ
jgi:hypothetical protein